MENYAWVYFGLGVAAVAAGTWAFCRWWFGRQLAAAAVRNDKLDKAHEFTGQQLMQARKQIESLQQELAAFKRGVAPHRTPPQARPVRAADMPEPTRPPSGFADTQIME